MKSGERLKRPFGESGLLQGNVSEMLHHTLTPCLNVDVYVLRSGLDHAKLDGAPHCDVGVNIHQRILKSHTEARHQTSNV